MRILGFQGLGPHVVCLFEVVGLGGIRPLAP